MRPRAPQPRRVRFNRRRGVIGGRRPARPRGVVIRPLRRRRPQSRLSEARRRPGRVAGGQGARPQGKLVPRGDLRRGAEAAGIRRVFLGASRPLV